MLGPLVVLAVLSTVGGWFALPAFFHGPDYFASFLAPVFGGGEATSSLVEGLTSRLDLKCEVGDPLRSFQMAPLNGRRGQWDVVAGLALRDIH